MGKWGFAKDDLATIVDPDGRVAAKACSEPRRGERHQERDRRDEATAARIVACLNRFTMMADVDMGQDEATSTSAETELRQALALAQRRLNWAACIEESRAQIVGAATCREVAETLREAAEACAAALEVRS